MGNFQKILKPTRARGLDTSGNNNHAQIYSGRALEFDGVSDYLTGPTTFPHSDTTIAMWITQDNATAEYRGITGRLSGGAETANWSIWWYEGKVRLYIGDGSGAENIESTTTLQNNTWYRLVCAVDFANKTGKIYLNGVLDKTVTWTRTHLEDSDGIGIGCLTVGNNLWEGKMSDFQIWNSTWTADDVTYDYLNPEQLALNRGGSSLTNSNLTLWYPMNEGHRGNQSYVLDASNTGLGDNLVTNSDFETSSANWTLVYAGGSGSGASIDAENTSNPLDGSKDLKIVNTSAGENAGAVSNGISFISGVTYKVSYKYKASASGCKGKIGHVNDSTGGSHIGGSEQQNLDNTTETDHSYIFTSTETETNYVTFIAPDGVTLQVDNVKVEPINNKNNATTAFYGDELNTTTNNRTFAGSNDWSVYNGTTVDVNSTVAGKMHITFEGDGTSQGAQLTIGDMGGTIVAGRKYRIEADLDYISGADTDIKFKFCIGGTNDATCVISATDGSPNDGGITTTEETYYSEVIATNTTGQLLILAKSAENDNASDPALITVDNVSVKEVGVASGWTDADQQLDIPQTALQSYNQLGWNDQADDSTNPIKSSVTPAFGTDDFAISFSFFTNEMTEQKFMYQGQSGTDGRIIFYTTSSGNIKIYSDSGGTAVGYEVITDNILTAGKWFHIIAVWNRTAGTVTSYVNGQLQSVSSDISGISGGFNGGGEFHPFRYSSTLQFVGSLTEIAYWKDTTFNASDAAELYNEGLILDATKHSKSSTLINYWRNDGLSTWKDLVGSDDLASNNMTQTMLITAGADSSRDSQGFLMNRQRTTNCINSINDNSSNSVGVNTEGVVVPHSNTLNITGNFTLCAWVKFKDLDNSYNIIHKKTQWDAPGYGLHRNTNGKLYLEYNDGVIGDGGQKQLGINFTPTLGEWYFVFATHTNSGNDIRGYALNTATTLTSSTTSGALSSVATNTEELTVGTGTGGDDNNHHRQFSGQIDDVQVYNEALDADELLRNFKAGKRSHK